MEDFFVSGTHFGGSDNECYLAFFPYDGGDQSVWYFGSILMKKHYTVFDMTPYVDRGENYLQIGLGTPNPENPLTINAD